MRSENTYIIHGERADKPMNGSTYNRHFKRYQDMKGITCTLHQLSHSYTSIAVYSHVPVDVLQRILGHANYQTTMDVYNEFRQESIDDARIALSDFYNKTKNRS